jgi:sigma-E factor negative regulatory protein RseA
MVMSDKLSAFMDGESPEFEARTAVASLLSGQEDRLRWASYHVIRDVLRDEALSIDVSERVSSAISSEPSILAPRPVTIFRAKRFAMSVAASVSAIAVVGWLAFGGLPGPSGTPDLLAVTPAGKATGGQPGVVETALSASAASDVQLVSVPSDSQMNEYLLAHPGFSPSTSLHGVAPYIRTVAVEQPGNR